MLFLERGLTHVCEDVAVVGEKDAGWERRTSSCGSAQPLARAAAMAALGVGARRESGREEEAKD